MEIWVKVLQFVILLVTQVYFYKMIEDSVQVI